jgi:hypothetical protein
MSKRGQETAGGGQENIKKRALLDNHFLDTPACK